jgi:hypothetical protein
MKHKQPLLLTGILLSFAAIVPANAEYFTDRYPLVSGNQPGSLFKPVNAPSGTTLSRSEGWEELTATVYPDNDVVFPGTGAWPDPLESKVGANPGWNAIDKTANGSGGGPYPSSASIYYGGTSSTINNDGGELSIVSSAGGGLLSGVKTVVFQIDIGEAWTYDLYNNVAPVLTYVSNTGSGAVTLAHQSLYKETPNGTVSMPSGTESLNINSRAYQFNLDGLGTISSFAIKFRGVQHSQLYGVGLQQFNAVASGSLLP